MSATDKTNGQNKVYKDKSQQNRLGTVSNEITEGFRVNITIVYEHTVCAMSAFSMCMLHIAFNVVLF